MFDFDNLKQGAVAAIGAIVFTATAVGAAVGPARIAETATQPAATQVAYSEIFQGQAASAEDAPRG